MLLSLHDDVWGLIFRSVGPKDRFVNFASASRSSLALASRCPLDELVFSLEDENTFIWFPLNKLSEDLESLLEGSDDEASSKVPRGGKKNDKGSPISSELARANALIDSFFGHSFWSRLERPMLSLRTLKIVDRLTVDLHFLEVLLKKCPNISTLDGPVNVAHSLSNLKMNSDSRLETFSCEPFYNGVVLRLPPLKNLRDLSVIVLDVGFDPDIVSQLTSLKFDFGPGSFRNSERSYETAESLAPEIITAIAQCSKLQALDLNFSCNFSKLQNLRQLKVQFENVKYGTRLQALNGSNLKALSFLCRGEGEDYSLLLPDLRHLSHLETLELEGPVTFSSTPSNCFHTLFETVTKLSLEWKITRMDLFEILPNFVNLESLVFPMPATEPQGDPLIEASLLKRIFLLPKLKHLSVNTYGSTDRYPLFEVTENFPCLQTYTGGFGNSLEKCECFIRALPASSMKWLNFDSPSGNKTPILANIARLRNLSILELHLDGHVVMTDDLFLPLVANLPILTYLSIRRSQWWVDLRAELASNPKTFSIGVFLQGLEHWPRLRYLVLEELVQDSFLREIEAREEVLSSLEYYRFTSVSSVEKQEFEGGWGSRFEYWDEMEKYLD